MNLTIGTAKKQKTLVGETRSGIAPFESLFGRFERVKEGNPTCAEFVLVGLLFQRRQPFLDTAVDTSQHCIAVLLC